MDKMVAVSVTKDQVAYTQSKAPGCISLYIYRKHAKRWRKLITAKRAEKYQEQPIRVMFTKWQ